MTTTADFVVAAAIVLAAALTWFFREREVAMLRVDAAEAKARAGELVTALAQSEKYLGESQRDLASARTRLETEREGFERERTGVEAAMRGQFQSLAQQTLGSVSSSFLDLAAARLAADREQIAGSVATRVEEIKGVLAPVHAEFTKFGQAVSAMQKHSAEDFGALKSQLTNVVALQASLQDAVRTTNDATGQLRNALQNPRIAGNWGETSLDRIVELAGMTEHCDFDRQTGVRSLDGTGERPDLTIRLTGGLRIPVDAKASCANYVRAASETDEMERARLLKQSALDLKGRLAELRARAYDRIEGYAGMTFVFVPSEAMLSSAVSNDPALFDDAMRDKIVLCSPLLLLCYLRAFANGWRIQQQEQHAEEVARRGELLFHRLQTFFVVLAKVGKYLNLSVDRYNQCVGKIDNLLAPSRELGKLLGRGGEVKGVETVDTAIREIRVVDTEASAA